MRRTTRIGLLAAMLLAVLPITLPASATPPDHAAAGRWIVQLKSTADPDTTAASHAGRYGARPEHIYRTAIKGYSATMSATAAARVAQDPDVVSVEADQVATVDAQTMPTGVDRIDDPANNNATLANLTIDGVDDKRVDAGVAVIDTGIDSTNAQLNVVAGTNCISLFGLGGSCTDGLPGDDNGHGTHVAGTIGAIDDGNSVVGVAPGVRLYAVKVLNSRGSGYLSDIVAGVDWVTARANVIDVVNMSLGCLDCTSSALTNAINNSINAGVVYAVAAGNDDADVSRDLPGNIPNVISVSALADFNGRSGGGGAATCRSDQDDTLADFSNWGAGIDIAAPGVCITSTWPGGLNTISGTSMATPHVAGAAALLASNSHPANATNVQTIRNSLVDAGNLNWTDDSGDGVKERLLDVTTFTPTTVAGGGSGGGGGGGTTNHPPVANFTGSCSGATCTYTSTSTDQDNDTLTYSWSGVSGATTNPTASRTYSNAGQYAVTLTVNDGHGGSNSKTLYTLCSSSGKGRNKVVTCAF